MYMNIVDEILENAVNIMGKATDLVTERRI